MLRVFVIVALFSYGNANADSFSYGNASEIDLFVDGRNVAVHGKVVKLVEPNILKIKTIQDKEKKVFYFKLSGLDASEFEGKRCSNHYFWKRVKSASLPSWLYQISNVDAKCIEVLKLVKKKNISVEVLDWNKVVHEGYAYHNGKNLNFNMIKEGVFGVDYMHTRDSNLVLMEKESRCLRKGMWKDKAGIIEETLKCQEGL